MEHPVLELRIDVRLLRIIGNGESSHGASDGQVAAVEPHVLFLPLLPALPLNRQHTVLKRDVDVVLLDVRQADLNEVVLGRLGDVARGCPPDVTMSSTKEPESDEVMKNTTTISVAQMGANPTWTG